MARTDAGGRGGSRGGRNQARPGRDVRGGRGGRDARGEKPQRGGKPGGYGNKGSKPARATGQYGPARGQAQHTQGQHTQGRAYDKRPADARGSAGDLIEGRRAVEEALLLGMPLKVAYVQQSQSGADEAYDRMAARLEAGGVPVQRVPRGRLDQMSSHGAHQGVVVRTEPFHYAELADVIARAGDGDALVIVLDHVTDEGNFGAIVRSAEVVGAAGVVVANARAASVDVGAYKTSAGAVLHLPIAQVSNLPRALADLKDAGFWACAATEHADQDVWDAPMGGRLALVMGSEGSGVSPLMLKSCDFAARLPQRGQVESLNVAQATTVMCYEWLRRVSAGARADDAPPAGDVPAALDVPTASDSPTGGDVDVQA